MDNKRNKEIYLKKEGLGKFKKHTYRELSSLYDLSINRLQYIVNRERMKNGGTK